MKSAPSSKECRNGWLSSLRPITVMAATMLELMIVVAIMGIILAMATPSIRSAFHREAFTQGMHDILDACEFARKEAIVHDTVMEMRIFPQSGAIEVAAVPRDTQYDDAAAVAPPSASDTPTPVIHSFSAQLSDRIAIKMLYVNFAEYKDADAARVRFYPNGTCNQFHMVIYSLDSSDYRTISLEEVTALAEATSGVQ